MGDTLAEDDLCLVERKDFALLDELQLLLRDVLARLIGQVLTVSRLQLPVR